MKVLITGANGMVAKAAIRHCEALGDEVLSFAKQELDISDEEAVAETIERSAPDTIINCAAFTDVDLAEKEKEKCFLVNAFGVENLAKAARAAGAKFLSVSTDYVFDGTKEGFYSEEDKPNPRGVYAKSKYEGEKLAQNAYKESMLIRTGWIFGKGGTNFLSIMPKLLLEGKEIKAIEDAFGTPTSADSLAARLRELAELGESGTFHVVNSGEGTSFAGFAEKICEILRLDKKLVKKISEKDLKRPAPRPRNSKLACLRSEKIGLSPLQFWEHAVERFAIKYKNAGL